MTDWSPTTRGHASGASCGSKVTDSQATHLKLRIHAKPQLSSHGEQQLKWTVAISGDGLEPPTVLILQDVITSSVKDECRWYLEQYTQQDPFGTSRARDACRTLTQYAKSLAGQLRLDEIIPSLLPETTLREKPLLVEIEVSEDQLDHEIGDKTIHQLHWETLEDTSQWLPNARLLVRRTLVHTEDGITSAKRVSPWRNPEGPISTLNLLLVVARDLSRAPSSYQDVTPSLASKVLSELGGKISQLSQSLRLNVEIVRPGTFEALQKHLERVSKAHGPGFFQMIHFDLHGTVRKSRGAKTAFLSFASPTSDRTVLVSAVSVAKLIQSHKIPFAVLNSCESARANAGDDANIAKIFQNADVQGIIAMSFKVSSHAAEVFLTSYYSSLLLQNLRFSESAYQARKVLRDDPVRPSRFGTRRHVLDWFVPVCYLRHSDLVFTSNQTQPTVVKPAISTSLNKTIQAQGATTPETCQLIGREFDLLRLETLLIKRTVVYLHGVFGVGKTAFLKHAQEIWISTSFVDVVAYIDLASANIGSAGAIANMVISTVIESEKYKGTKGLGKCGLQTEGSVEDGVIFRQLHEALQELRILIIFDRLQDCFSNLRPDILQKSSRDPAASLKTFLSNIDQFGSGGTKSDAPYLVFTGRKGLSWFSTHVDTSLDIATFELPALQMSDALDLAQSLLETDDSGKNDMTPSALDQLESIVELLRSNPGAICEVLPYLEKAHIIPEHRYQYLRNCSFIGSFEELREKSTSDPCFSEIRRLCSTMRDQTLATLIILSLYWHESPRLGSMYEMSSTCGLCTDTDSFGTTIRLLDERGYITLATRSPYIVWIHPLFTLCLRSIATLLETLNEREMSELAYESLEEKLAVSAPLTLEAGRLLKYLLSETPPAGSSHLSEAEGSSFCKKFLEGLELLWQWKYMTAITSGIDVKDMSDFYLSGLLNTITCIDLIATMTSDLPLKDWPHTLFGRFSAHVKVVGTATQKKLSAKHFEKLVKSLVAYNGYSVDVEHFSYVQNLWNYLVWSHMVGSLSDVSSQRAQELHKMSLEVLRASEENSGSPMQGIALYEKACTIRLEAMLRLVEGKYTEALDTWKRFLVLDDLWIQYLGTQAQINRDQQKSLQLAQFGDSFILGQARDKKQAAEMHARLQSAFQFPIEKAYAESRKKATAFIEAIVTSEGAAKPQAWENEVLPALMAFSPELKNVADVQRAAGLKGLENHPDGWPENSDLVALSQKYDDRSQRLHGLESATDSGDWVNAAKHHQFLTKLALQSADIDEALSHAAATMDIYERDPAFASSLTEIQPLHLLLTGQQSYWNAILDDSSTATPEKMAQAVPAINQMINALKLHGVPPEQLEGLEIAKQMWSDEAELGFERKLSVIQGMANENGEQSKDQYKKWMQLVMPKSGDKQYLAEFSAEHARIMRLFKQSSDLERTGKPEDLVRALEVLDELESLKSTDSGSLLINLDAIQVDRERFHCKLNSVAAINKFDELAAAGQYRESLDQIIILQGLMKTAARLGLPTINEALEGMYLEAERGMWNQMFTAAFRAEAGTEHRIQLWTDLLTAHEQKKFAHLDPSEIAILARNARQSRLLDLAACSHGKRQFVLCVVYYEDWMEEEKAARGLDSPGYKRILEIKENIELVVYNNKYAQADVDCKFDQALEYIDMLEEVFRRKEKRLPPGTWRKTPQDQMIEQQLLKARFGLNICMNIMKEFGPVAGQQMIETQRRLMGYKAPFL